MFIYLTNKEKRRGKRVPIGRTKRFLFVGEQYWGLNQGLTLVQQALYQFSHSVSPKIDFLRKHNEI
jgi:hypothetical protein